MPVHSSNAAVGVVGLVAALVVSGCSIIDTPTIRGSGTLETQGVGLSGPISRLRR